MLIGVLYEIVHHHVAIYFFLIQVVVFWAGFLFSLVQFWDVGHFIRVDFYWFLFLTFSWVRFGGFGRLGFLFWVVDILHARIMKVCVKINKVVFPFVLILRGGRTSLIKWLILIGKFSITVRSLCKTHLFGYPSISFLEFCELLLLVGLVLWDFLFDLNIFTPLLLIFWLGVIKWLRLFRRLFLIQIRSIDFLSRNWSLNLPFLHSLLLNLKVLLNINLSCRVFAFHFYF